MATCNITSLNLTGNKLYCNYHHSLLPISTLQVVYYERYQKLRSDSLVPLEDHVTTFPTPLLLLQIPHQFLLHPPSHHAYLAAALSSLNLPPQFVPRIISLALNLATNTNSLECYSIVAGLEYLRIEQIDQTNDFDEILRAQFRDMVDAGVAPSDDIDYLVADFMGLLDGFGLESAPSTEEEGASTSAIDKLVKNGSFVVSSSEEGQGFDVGFTCSVCLEEPQAGDKLIRMNCSHIYHQSCLLPWLQKRNTCPNCRCKLDEK
ncbi:uncharacterized protein LOC142641781 [Castanea sativa]|uniref:uncharacterized protein LOC142641781 n=1 Tax=Castanea sativa TaxID=21020 RepID=UPI003F64DA6E